MGKYLVSLTGRIDATSRFPESSRFGFFPSLGLGWIVSDEEFLKNNDLISFLKVRAGYGLTGNAEIGNFDYLSTYGANAYGNQAGLTPGNFTDGKTTWETTRQLDTGLEIGLLKDRVTISLDYYNKDTRDLLLNVNVPSTSGYTVQQRNIGKISNHGFEVAINSRNLEIADFKWNTNFNISFNRNKVISTNGIIIAPGNRSRVINEAREGQPIGVLFGVKYAGVDPNNGDALYYTEDGGTTNDYSAGHRQVIGDPNPDFIGGLTNIFTYKGFELNLFAQFVYGNDIYNMAGGFMTANGDYFDNQTKEQLNRWRNPGDITYVPQARLYGGNGTAMSSRYIYDGSYIRLKTATLAYTLPKTWLSKAKLSNVRMYVTGQNLLTAFSKRFQGWDPELSSGFTQTSNQSSNIIFGNDFYTPPQARTIIFGINISL
ncbi:MAG: TonB-dependent receptor [Bacteroidetes bacterium]|nr:MAG: TonB-dependent receptor [Bacteroidota bacterium]